jgi:hypothetical protein
MLVAVSTRLVSKRNRVLLPCESEWWAAHGMAVQPVHVALVLLAALVGRPATSQFGLAVSVWAGIGRNARKSLGQHIAPATIGDKSSRAAGLFCYIETMNIYDFQTLHYTRAPALLKQSMPKQHVKIRPPPPPAVADEPPPGPQTPTNRPSASPPQRGTPRS